MFVVIWMDYGLYWEVGVDVVCVVVDVDGFECVE